jgi:triosephosphate isomerase (TIM)
LRQRLAGLSGRDVVVAPTHVALVPVVDSLRGSEIEVAGQNVYWEDRGAFTGEVSAPMLVDAGCTHVIVGHSERRQFFGETDESVGRRIRAALRHSLTPIVCVGETLEERESGRTFARIAAQIDGALSGLSASDIARLVVAYEPVWAIGTGKVATPAQAQEVHARIRALLANAASEQVAAQLRILYGGSVKADNVDLLMSEADVDGALVGGASLKAEEFARIVRFEA